MFNPYAKKKSSNPTSSNTQANHGSSTTATIVASSSRSTTGGSMNISDTAIQNRYSINNNNTYNKKRGRENNDYNNDDTKISAGSNVSNNFASITAVATTTTAATASSFSQAFEAVEETDYYKEQIHEYSDDNIAILASERAKQRAFEQVQQHQSTNNNKSTTEDEILQATLNPKTDATVVTTNTTTAFQSDRDHHILFQQPHVLYVSTKQKGNGVLNYIRNVPITYQTMVPDYIMNSTRCALFLSIKYHNLYPNYIHKRIAALKTDFTLRVLLVLVDVEDNANVLLQMNKLAVTHNMTLLLAWSEEEAARYLETFKVMDGKDAKSIQRKEQLYFGDQVADFVTTKKTGINKTDAALLIDQFDTIQNLALASVDELAIIHGMGEIKVRKLYDAFHKPFSKKLSLQRKKKQQELEQQQQQQQPTVNNEPIPKASNVPEIAEKEQLVLEEQEIIVDQE